MHDLLAGAALRFGDKDALVAGESRVSFAELEAASNSFARHLAARGIGKRDRVAVMMSNRPEFVVVVNAVSKLGAAPVLLSPAWKAFETSHAVEITSVVHAVGDEATVALLAEAMGEGLVTDIDDTATYDAAFHGQQTRPAQADIDPECEAVLVFSSGTTGMPKAVRHTHRSISCATRHWYEGLGLGPDDRFQVATPPSHILGLLNLLAAAATGVTVRLHLARAVGREPPHARALRHGLGHARRDRSRPPHDVAQRREVVALEIGLVRHGEGYGRHGHLERHTVRFDPGEDLLQVEATVQTDGHAGSGSRQ